MSSEAQIAANRQNALSSTGPKTPEGKAIVAQNAAVHGLRAETIILPGENSAEFEAFSENMIGQLSPLGPVECHLAERIVIAAWRLRRTVGVEQELVFRLGHYYAPGKPSRYISPAQAFMQDGRSGNTLERISRYEAHLQRSFRRDLKDLIALQSLRPKSSGSSSPKPQACISDQASNPRPQGCNSDVESSQLK